VPFTPDVQSGVKHWKPSKSPDAAHATLLKRLRVFVGDAFKKDGTALTERHQGNLGEFIVYVIEDECSGLKKTHLLLSAANAYYPVANNSKTDLDLFWFKMAAKEADDNGVIHEVKTAITDDLSVASTLAGDFEKLFGTDANLTLGSRIRLIKTQVEFGSEDPARFDRAKRLTALVGKGPGTSPNLTLVPSLVFDDAKITVEKARKRLATVHAKIEALGWKKTQIAPMCVSLPGLEDRLTRLLCGGA